MADENKVIDLETLSHFKAKQDLYNANTYKRKDDASDLKGAVRYDTAQVLTETEKAQARANLGITENGGSGGSVEGAVRYDVQQTLSDDAKARARENIGTTDGTWENMPDKPFGYYTDEERYPTITWDGDVSGKVTVEHTIETEGMSVTGTYVKVCDSPYGNGMISTKDFLEQYNEFVMHNFGEDSAEQFPIKSENFGSTSLYNYDINVPFVVYVIDGYTVFEGISFPEAGIYFMYVDGSEVGVEGAMYVKSIKAVFSQTINEDFLPKGLVTTDENGLIPASKLPSYVDDVVEGNFVKLAEDADGVFNTVDGEHITPESGKIYIDLATGNTYRWSGSVYVRLNPDEYTLATTSDIDALFT